MKIQGYSDLPNKTLEKLPETWVSYLWSVLFNDVACILTKVSLFLLSKVSSG